MQEFTLGVYQYLVAREIRQHEQGDTAEQQAHEQEEKHVACGQQDDPELDQEGTANSGAQLHNTLPKEKEPGTA